MKNITLRGLSPAMTHPYKNVHQNFLSWFYKSIFIYLYEIEMVPQ